MNKLYEIKAICTNINCKFFLVVGYIDDKDNLTYAQFPDGVYDGVCPKCNGELNFRVFDVKETSK